MGPFIRLIGWTRAARLRCPPPSPPLAPSFRVTGIATVAELASGSGGNFGQPGRGGAAGERAGRGRGERDVWRGEQRLMRPIAHEHLFLHSI